MAPQEQHIPLQENNLSKVITVARRTAIAASAGAAVMGGAVFAKNYIDHRVFEIPQHQAAKLFPPPDGATLFTAQTHIAAARAEHDVNDAHGIDVPLTSVDVASLPAAYDIVKKEDLYEAERTRREGDVADAETWGGVSIFFGLVGVGTGVLFENGYQIKKNRSQDRRRFENTSVIFLA